MVLDQTCPCGTGRSYRQCCGSLHRAGRAGLGTTAEQLMRARYSAYVVGNDDFVLATWDPSHRPSAVDPDPETVWLDLEIVDTSGGDGFANVGSVEFRAHYRRGNDIRTLHELSRFERIDGNWFYVDGTLSSDPKS